jgi:hypothetical protein
MASSDNTCRRVKDILYNGKLGSLPTFRLRELLSDNGVDDSGYRADLCKRIRSDKELLSKVGEYEPEFTYYVVGERRKRLTSAEEKESEEEEPDDEGESGEGESGEGESGEEEEKVSWEDILKGWEEGEELQYPGYIDGRFFYETSLSGPDEAYEEEFIRAKELDKLKQSYKNYQIYIKESGDSYSTSFLTPDKKAILLIPKPRKDQDYTTMKDFIDNASENQRIAFWKAAAKIIRGEWKKGKKVYVSTHGSGVPYFHLRIEETPKYYKTERFKVQ